MENLDIKPLAELKPLPEGATELELKRHTILQAVVRAYNQTKHYQSFNKRVIRAVELELAGLGDGRYSVSTAAPRSLETLKIWHNWDYNEGVTLCWNASERWQDGLAHEIARQDITDAIERRNQEKTLERELFELEQTVVAAKNKALQLVRSLPIPESATLRTEAYFWSSPSSGLVKTFPHLFEN